MSQPAITTVAAAIAAVGDDLLQESGVDINNNDALSALNTKAIDMVANELMRAGMSMVAAKQMADNAAAMSAKATADSRDLASRAFTNQHNPVPAAANDTAGTPAGGVSGDPGESTPELAPDADADADADEENEAEAGADAGTASTQASHAPAAHTLGAAPTAQAHAGQADRVHAPAIISSPLMWQPRTDFQVLTKPVDDIFTNISKVDPLFAFDLPIVAWDKPHPDIPERDPEYQFDRQALFTILYAIATRKSLSIVGPHGCGKTSIVNQVAARLGYPVCTIPMDGQLTRSLLFGKEKIGAGPNGNFTYFRDGILPRALLEPTFILFDEIDRGVSDLQYSCHSVYLQEGLSILEDDGRFIPMHPCNRVFGTANTKGRGSLDGMYQASEDMTEATRDRWSLWLEMDYQGIDDDTEVVQSKANISLEDAKIIARLAHQVREAFLESKLSQTCSMRQQLEVAEFYSFMSNGETEPDRRARMMGLAVDTIMCGRATSEDASAIRDLLKTIHPSAVSDEPLLGS